MKHIKHIILSVLVLSASHFTFAMEEIADSLGAPREVKNEQCLLIKHRATTGSFYVDFGRTKGFLLSDPHYSYVNGDGPTERAREHITFLAKNSKKIAKQYNKVLGYSVTIINDSWKQAVQNIVTEHPELASLDETQQELHAQAYLSSVRVFFKEGSDEVETIEIKSAAGNPHNKITIDRLPARENGSLVTFARTFLMLARAAIDEVYQTQGRDFDLETPYYEPQAGGLCTQTVEYIEKGEFSNYLIKVDRSITRR